MRPLQEKNNSKQFVQTVSLASQLRWQTCLRSSCFHPKLRERTYRSDYLVVPKHQPLWLFQFLSPIPPVSFNTTRGSSDFHDSGSLQEDLLLIRRAIFDNSNTNSVMADYGKARLDPIKDLTNRYKSSILMTYEVSWPSDHDKSMSQPRRFYSRWWNHQVWTQSKRWGELPPG